MESKTIEYEGPPPPQYQPYPTTHIQNPPPSDPLGMNECGLTGQSQYKYPKVHDIFAGILMGFGAWVVVQTIITLVKIVIYSTSIQVDGSVYAGLAISFGNGAITAVCGYLIFLAVKSRKIDRLKLPMILEIIAAVLVLIAFGIVVYQNVLLSRLTDGGVYFLYIIAAIVYGLEGMTYVAHLVLCFIEINAYNHSTRQNQSEVVKYQNFH